MDITLTFTKEQLGVINALLMDAPYRLAAPLVQNINLQIQQQSNQVNQQLTESKNDSLGENK